MFYYNSIVICCFACLFPRDVLPKAISPADRMRRGVDSLIESITLTDEEKTYIVTQHNDYRKLQGASDMLHITWDNDLANFAKNYVMNCEFQHSVHTSVGSFSTVGENLGISYTTSTVYDRSFIKSTTDAWYNEISAYNYENSTCQASSVCGHYTQVVWASTYKIGCGAAFCSSSVYHHSLLVSCNYGPAGNILNNTLGRVGQPFKKGIACSACPAGDNCASGLCANSVRDGDQSTATSQPFSTSLSTSQPFSTSPSTSQPFSTSPSTSQPFSTSPSPSQPFSTSPSTGQPFSTSPSTSQPFSTSPSTGQPFSTSPSTSQPFSTSPSTATNLSTKKGNPKKMRPNPKQEPRFIKKIKKVIQRVVNLLKKLFGYLDEVE